MLSPMLANNYNYSVSLGRKVETLRIILGRVIRNLSDLGIKGGGVGTLRPQDKDHLYSSKISSPTACYSLPSPKFSLG